MNVRFNVRGYIDRRGPREIGAARALEQSRADARLEDLWRERVRLNEARRMAARGNVIAMRRRA